MKTKFGNLLGYELLCFRYSETRNQLGQILHDAVTTLAENIDGAVRRISTSYNQRGLTETVASWDNSALGVGNVVNEVEFSYDAFNLVTSDKQEHSGSVGGSTPAVSYTFTDGSNNTLRLTSCTTPSGIQTNHAYGLAGSIDDAFNRAGSLQVQGEASNLVEYQYAGLSLTAKVLYPAPNAELSYLATAASGTGDGGDSLVGYDRFNRVIKMPWKNKSNNTFLAQICYGYDAASRRKWRQDLTPATEREQDRFYTYDHLRQVKSAAVGTLNENRTAIGGIPIQAETWNYDETGSWLAYQKAADGVTTVDETRINNQSNQITQIDGLSAGIAHDLNGNTTLLPTGEGLQGSSRILKWDAWNRLVEVRNANDNSLVASYAYDGLFRRITVTDSATTVTHSFYNRQWRVVEERKDASVNPSQVFYWGARSRWEFIRRDRDIAGNGSLDEALYCLTDAMDPIAIVNSNGSVVERYDYTAFGNTGFLAPDFSERTGSGFDWNFLFHGEFRDADTGMYNYGFRYYDPQTGRWVNRDLIAEDGGYNLYGFGRNNGIDNVDIIGLKDLPEGWNKGEYPDSFDPKNLPPYEPNQSRSRRNKNPIEWPEETSDGYLDANEGEDKCCSCVQKHGQGGIDSGGATTARPQGDDGAWPPVGLKGPVKCKAGSKKQVRYPGECVPKSGYTEAHCDGKMCYFVVTYTCKVERGRGAWIDGEKIPTKCQ